MACVVQALRRAGWFCLAVFGVCLAVAGQARADLSFVAATSLRLGGWPTEVAAGDFNEDGRPDLAVVDYSGGSVKILLSTGDTAGFSEAGVFSMGGAPYGLVAADFNGDGHLDVAVTSFNNGNVVVRLGDGNGGLSAAVAFAVGPNPTGLTVSDFDGDGRLDLAIAITGGWSARGIFILWGDGSGRFDARPGTSIGLSIQARHIVSGDWNEDGFADVVLGSGDGVFLMLGNGAGGFAASQRLTGDEDAPFVAVGDADGDGHQDILALVQNSFTSPVLLIGDGQGGFSRKNVGIAYGRFSGGQIVDVTGDGFPDLVLSRYSGTVLVVPGLAGGRFSLQTQEYAVGEDVRRPVVADFNRDGHPDIVVSNDQGGQGGHLVYLRGDGAGQFAAARSYADPERYIRAIATADFDEDGRADLAVIHRDEDSVWILRGDGTGAFDYRTRLETGAGPSSLAAGDLNGDGHADLAVVNETDSTVMVFLGNGFGGFTSAGQQSFIALAPMSVTMGSFQGPGKPAYAAVWALETAGVYEGIRWVGVSPQGTIEQLNMSTWDNVTGFTSLDVNQDGLADLVAATSAGTVGTGLTAGSGSSASPVPQDPTYLPVGIGALRAVAGWSQAGQSGVFTSGGTQIASLTSTQWQPLSVAGIYNPGIAASVLASFDFDGDGAPDVVAADATSGELAIMRGQGAPGGLGGAFLRYGGGTPEQMVMADFNGDGLTDIAMANGYGGVAVLMNASPSPNAALASLALSQGALSPAFAGGVTAYTVTVPHGVAQLSLTPVAAQAGASITVNGVPVTSGAATAPLPLAVGSSVIQVEVLAQNGVARRTYTVTVERGQAPQHAVTATAGGGGSISPAGVVNVTEGQVGSFTIAPTAGYRIAAVTGCGGALAGSTYTTAAVTAACTVQARFETLPTPTNTGSGPVNVGVVDGSAGCQLDLAGTGPVAAPAPYPGATLPHGAFRLRLINCQPGETVRVAVTFPDLTGFTVKKYGPTPDSPLSSRYYDPVNLQISGNTVTYDVTDGGWGDNSFGAQDGTINDPVVPVLLAPSPAAIPTLSTWGLGGLAALLGLLALRGGRRTSARFVGAVAQTRF